MTKRPHRSTGSGGASALGKHQSGVEPNFDVVQGQAVAGAVAFDQPAGSGLEQAVAGSLGAAVCDEADPDLVQAARALRSRVMYAAVAITALARVGPAGRVRRGPQRSGAGFATAGLCRAGWCAATS